MKITIIGWYGTETIGDRAIFAGILSLLSNIIDSFEIKLGCLDTLLTERSLFEDFEYYKKCSNNHNLSISLFDSRNKKDLDSAIIWSDWVVVGGGPLMEISEMHMLKYAFQKGHKSFKKNILMGCGFGPFKTSSMEKIAYELVILSDIAIFRDTKSKEIIESALNKDNLFASIDPAVFACDYYNNNCVTTEHDSYIAINLRKPTDEYSGNDKIQDNFFVNLLMEIHNKHKDLAIKMVPMHSFVVGYDDRYYLNKIKLLTGLNNLYVYNKPPTLTETMNLYKNALFCFGMRFHSVLLQTILNGRNYVLDYTDPIKGKIFNLLNQLNVFDKYQNRYYSLVSDNGCIKVIDDIEKIIIPDNLILDFKNVYVHSLGALL